MGTKAYDQKLENLLALRSAPSSVDTLSELRKALRDRSGYYVAKAASLTGELGLSALRPNLLDAFERFLAGGAKLDPQCWAKHAIAEALSDLGHDDPAVFLKGCQHFQPEPVWGGQQDTAIRLRGACTLALVQCKISEFELLQTLVDMLGDPERGVRMEAARAIGQCSSREAGLLLRLKATAGDAEAEVIGQCLIALLDLDADAHLAYVARFLDAAGDLRFEALAALSECRDPRAAQILIDSLARTRDAGAKEGTLLALGRSRHQAAADFLLAQVADARVADACLCTTALARGPWRESAREQVHDRVRRRANEKLAQTFNSEFPALETTRD